MMWSSVLIFAFAIGSPPFAPANDHGFIGGHVFVSELESEACYRGNNWILEIDPRTGKSWRIADIQDGLCVNNGLAFTPDGKRLRVANFRGSTVMEFDAHGNGVVIYDRDDGISAPTGQNSLAYDAFGNFYVSNRGTLQILKFPVDGGPATVFADFDDGIVAGASLAFAPNGDLFVADGDSAVLRITPEGDATVFEEFDGRITTTTIGFDSAGNLFLGVQVGGPEDKIYRYDAGLVENKRLLISGLHTAGRFALTVAPDQRDLYVVDRRGVYAIDAQDGTKRVLFEFPSGEYHTSGGLGIAVFIPAGRGDLNCDGSLDLADVEPFIVALLDAEKYKQKYPDCDIKRADITLDGSVDLLDVEPFITLLLG